MNAGRLGVGITLGISLDCCVPLRPHSNDYTPEEFKEIFRSYAATLKQEHAHAPSEEMVTRIKHLELICADILVAVAELEDNALWSQYFTGKWDFLEAKRSRGTVDDKNNAPVDTKDNGEAISDADLTSEAFNSCDLEEPYTDQQRMRAAHIAVACHYGKKIFSPATCYTDLLHSEERAEDFKKVVRLYIAKTTKKKVKDREIAREKFREEKSANQVL
ncbi:hypothetical protein B0H65DRAFT_570696 [Neurospora tetraspora]|uniref:Uncharacterized protein n=1 Tax=Neurospora tetraspora TaxID=94610 RepID=A0AAE0JHK4_9PEZI|nr:hypothetical protein B0H65DRAFT_570696 [Neurospora tetraspora]